MKGTFTKDLVDVSTDLVGKVVFADMAYDAISTIMQESADRMRLCGEIGAAQLIDSNIELVFACLCALDRVELVAEVANEQNT